MARELIGIEATWYEGKNEKTEKRCFCRVWKNIETRSYTFFEESDDQRRGGRDSEIVEKMLGWCWTIRYPAEVLEKAKQEGVTLYGRQLNLPTQEAAEECIAIEIAKVAALGPTDLTPPSPEPAKKLGIWARY